VASTFTRDISQRNENRSFDEMEDNSATDETSEEESNEYPEDLEEPDIDPKDSLLEGIINAWVCLVPLIEEAKFDEEFPGYFEVFECLVQHHKNPAIKIASCEAIITLNDLNERLPADKQYDIEIQPLVDKLNSYAQGCLNNRSNKNNPIQKKQRLIWLNLARALEADKCVVELPFISVQSKFIIVPTKIDHMDKRKHQNRARRETCWTNWPEAMTIKYIKNNLGTQFNELMQGLVFNSKIFQLLDQKASWHQQNPLSMEIVQFVRHTRSGYAGWSPKWWKKNGKHTQKDSIKTSTRNNLFM